MFRSSLGCLAVVILVTISTAADNAVTIKDFIPKSGQRIKTTLDGKAIHKQTATLKDFPPNIKEEVKTRSFVFIDEVLENSGNSKKPSKLKRTYEKAVMGKDGMDTKMAIEGKTIVIEKKNDKYVFREDGNELTGEARTFLEKEFNRKGPSSIQDLQAKYPTKVGESTTIDKISEIVKEFEAGGIWTFDKDKSTGKISLSKLYNKMDKLQFAVLDVVMEAPITGTSEKSEWVIRDGKMTMNITEDACIDGSSPEGTGTMKMKFTANLATDDIELKLETGATETSKIQLLK